MSLTPPDRFPENVGIEPIIIPELELCDVKWKVPAADFVIAADNAPLEDRPEAFNRVRVDRADIFPHLGVLARLGGPSPCGRAKVRSVQLPLRRGRGDLPDAPPASISAG